LNEITAVHFKLLQIGIISTRFAPRRLRIV